ncbi:MAG: hypothetical protein AB7P76_05925 [Candidatus Melainabacteria bacterium]
MSATQPVSHYNQAGFAYPERPVYQVARAYGEVFPYTRALGSALRANGTRLDKFGAGTDTLTHWLGFRAVYRGFQRWLDKQYNKHPALAETLNRHPVAVGLPITLAGATVAQLGGSVTHRVWRRIRRSEAVEGTVEKALHTAPGNAVAKAFRPLEKIARNPLFRLPLAILGAGFFVTLLGRVVQDRLAFGHAYKQTRQELPRDAADPYTAHALTVNTLQARRNPGFQAFQTEPAPTMSNLVQGNPFSAPLIASAPQTTVSLPSTASSWIAP